MSYAAAAAHRPLVLPALLRTCRRRNDGIRFFFFFKFAEFIDRIGRAVPSTQGDSERSVWCTCCSLDTVQVHLNLSASYMIEPQIDLLESRSP